MALGLVRAASGSGVSTSQSLPRRDRRGIWWLALAVGVAMGSSSPASAGASKTTTYEPPYAMEEVWADGKCEGERQGEERSGVACTEKGSASADEGTLSVLAKIESEQGHLFLVGGKARTTAFVEEGVRVKKPSSTVVVTVNYRVDDAKASASHGFGDGADVDLIANASTTGGASASAIKTIAEADSDTQSSQSSKRSLTMTMESDEKINGMVSVFARVRATATLDQDLMTRPETSSTASAQVRVTSIEVEYG